MGQPVTSWLYASVPETRYITRKRLAKALLLFSVASLTAGLSLATAADTSAAANIPALVANITPDLQHSQPPTRPLLGANRAAEREQYLAALSAIKQGQHSRYLRLRADLVQYPLYPYLEYTDKIYNLGRQDSAAIQAFVAQWRDTPLASQLRQNWLYYLAKKHRWSEFLSAYEITDSTRVNQCFYAYALFKAKRVAEAYSEAQRLWLVGESQPDECDAIFKVWRGSSAFVSDFGWQRFQLAMDNNEVTLARYLLRYVDGIDKTMASAYLDVHRKPELIRQHQRFTNDSTKNRQVISHGLQRLARRDAAAALTTFENYRTSHQFDTTETEALYVYIGLRLSINGDTDGLLDQLPINIRTQQTLLEARIRLALQQLDWGQALVFINLLEQQGQQSTRWQYWKARILAGSRDPADIATAMSIYREMAEQRDFYSFLAADILGSAYNFEDRPADISEEEILALAATPGIQRAAELFALQELTRARREWRFTTRDYSGRERQIAARVTQTWGQYNQAIRSMIDAQAWDDLAIRFPLAYHDTFASSAQAADIPLPWSIAVARQESAFMPDARSGAGAMGLMQLLPSTAKQTARRQGLSYSSARQLIDPTTNIQLGTAYLGSMLRRFNNNRILASAAYNAGPSRVQGWLNPSLPLDVWIETIPFRETRNYVQNVLMFTSIYARRLNQLPPLITPNEWNDFARSNPLLTLAP